VALACAVLQDPQLAARIVSGGGVRVNGVPAPSLLRRVGAGDVLTFAQARAIRVVRIVGAGHAAGPRAEAQALYDDLDPPGDRADGSDEAQRAGPRAHEEGAAQARRSARSRRMTCGENGAVGAGKSPLQTVNLSLQL
jgi:ribosome-associated heat shock protein Hsp15